MVNALFDRTDALLERWYASVGAWSGSLIIASFLVFVVWLYVDGGTEPISGGAMYAELSKGPFDTTDPNHVRNRIFAPLVGWVLHMRGPLFVLVPWLFLIGFLALVDQ